MSMSVIGDLAADHYLMLPPRHDTDEKRTAKFSLWLPGGTGANAAAAAAALGSQVTLYSFAGTDALGRWLMAALAARGVSTDGVRVVPGNTTQATILLEPGDRQVIVDRGVAGNLDDIDPGQLGTADVVYVTGSAAAIARIAGARAGGLLIAGIEAGMADHADLAAQIRNADLVITNSAGWAIFSRHAASVTAVETQGPRGAVIHTPSKPDQHIPGLAVNAVDETGAGDCLAGALCHYLAAGLDLAAACRLAVVAAGLSTLGLGAQGRLPTDAEVRAAATRGTMSTARSGASR
jgi:sugar/nucleoside kinase (ribokinase family)